MNSAPLSLLKEDRRPSNRSAGSPRTSVSVVNGKERTVLVLGHREKVNVRVFHV